MDEADSDDEEESDDEESGEEEKFDDDGLTLRNEDDLKFVLRISVNKFMPQWSEQILGPAKTYKIKQDYNNPSKSLPQSALKLHQCATCNLTWLFSGSGEPGWKESSISPNALTRSCPHA